MDGVESTPAVDAKSSLSSRSLNEQATPVVGSFRHLARRSLVYTAGGFLAKASKFLLIPLYVRLLSQVEVGALMFVEAISIALARAFSFGLSNAVRRYYVDYDDQRAADAYTSAVWWVGTAFALVGGVALTTAMLLWGDGLTQQVVPYYLALAVVAGVLQSNMGIPLQRYVIREEAGRHTALTVLPFVTTAAVVIVLLTRFNMGVDGVLWGQIITFSLWNIGIGVSMLIPTRPVFRAVEIKEAIRYSAPVLPHVLFTWGLTFADRLVLERYVKLDVLGVYVIGYQMASVVTIISFAVVNAWLPRFFRSASSGTGEGDFAVNFTHAFLVIVSVALSLIVAAPEVIAVVATNVYAGAVVVLRITAIGLVLHGCFQLLLLPIFYSNRTRWVAAVSGIAFATNVLVNIVFIPVYGIIAAAWATVAAYAIAAIAAFMAAQLTYPVKIEYLRVLGISAWAVAIGAVGWRLESLSFLSAVLVKSVLFVCFLGGLMMVFGGRLWLRRRRLV